jgi:hypothetical protein
MPYSVLARPFPLLPTLLHAEIKISFSEEASGAFAFSAKDARR